MTPSAPAAVPNAVRSLEALLVARIDVLGAPFDVLSKVQPQPQAVNATLTHHLLTHRAVVQRWLATLDPTNARAVWTEGPQRLLTGRLRRWLQARNQFLTFDDATTASVETVYSRAGRDLQDALATDDRTALEAVFQRHHARLSAVLAERLGRDLHAAPGSHYSPSTQLAVLGLAAAPPGARVLDLGCGPGAPLVKHLRALGLDAHGIDRVHGDDWLTVDFADRRWDLVVSHLGFSLHFLHHEQRHAEAAYDYARTYMRILASLRPGGVFAYAPALPFFEPLIGSDFEVRRLPWPAGRPPGILNSPGTPLALSAYRATQVTRLS